MAVMPGCEQETNEKQADVSLYMATARRRIATSPLTEVLEKRSAQSGITQQIESSIIIESMENQNA